MYQLTINEDKNFTLERQDRQWKLDGSPAQFDASMQPNGLISVLHNGRNYTAMLESIDYAAKEVLLRINGQSYKAAIKEPLDLLLSNMGLNLKAAKHAEPIKAPMPGMVLKILVTPGQQIQKGDGLIILEAMKMENILKATTAATVKTIKVTERTAVEKGAVLIELA